VTSLGDKSSDDDLMAAYKVPREAASVTAESNATAPRWNQLPHLNYTRLSVELEPNNLIIFLWVLCTRFPKDAQTMALALKSSIAHIYSDFCAY
jgi:hypothetical protein